MNMYQKLYRYALTNLFTVYYSLLALVVIFLNYVKNPFRNPWTRILNLTPPDRLRDPKHGVHKYVKVNNTIIHYVESGDNSKSLILFLHGFPEFWYSWRHQIAEFKKDYWCVAVDMRGYGDSERPEDVNAYKIELLVQDVYELIKTLGSKKCILVAHDWGGLIACRVRDVYPEMFSAVVILGSTSREAWIQELWTNPVQRKMSWYVFLYRVPELPEKLLSMYDGKVFEKMLLVKGKSTIDDEDIACFKFWYRKAYAFTPPINYYRANFTVGLPEKKPNGDVPMLVAQGSNEAYLTNGILENMKKEYPNIETAIVDDAGHFLQQEEPEKVNKLIKEFLVKHNL